RTTIVQLDVTVGRQFSRRDLTDDTCFLKCLKRSCHIGSSTFDRPPFRHDPAPSPPRRYEKDLDGTVLVLSPWQSAILLHFVVGRNQTAVLVIMWHRILYMDSRKP